MQAFRIKICGLTTVEDVRLSVEAGADAVGLNFYPASRRFIAPPQAAELSAAVPDEVLCIGLFVNARRESIAAAVEQFGLDAIQLHGDEPPEMLPDLPPVPLLRAFRLSSAPDAPEAYHTAAVLAYLDLCLRHGRIPDWLLIDAYAHGQPGGTGQLGDWQLASELVRMELPPPIVLAGGLNPANVADAIQAVGPAAVDVASGVEAPDGRKDPHLVWSFVAAARRAFTGNDGTPLGAH